jgi:HD superfamily phosphohydrolase
MKRINLFKLFGISCKYNKYTTEEKVHKLKNMWMINQIRFSSNSRNGKGNDETIREWKEKEETMKEWDIKYKEEIDKYYEDLKKKRESRINSINESISKSGYETVPETEKE